MAGQETVTVAISSEVKQQLVTLAEQSQCSASELAGAMISEFLAHESAITSAIEQGLQGFHSGKIVAHKQIASELDAIIAVSSSVN